MRKANTDLQQELEKTTDTTEYPNRISNQVPHEWESRRVTTVVSSVVFILIALFRMKIAKACEG
jgi:hypothetical protein